MAIRQNTTYTYIYIRVVTKYFYSKYNIYGPSSRPNNSPATRNAKIQYFYQIYLYYRIYIYIYLNYKRYTYTTK